MISSDLIPTGVQNQFDNSFNSSSISRKKPKYSTVNTAYIYIQTLGLPLISSSTGSPTESIRLESGRAHTFGRTRHLCDSVFDDPRVSKIHFQIIFDSVNRKLLLSDGVFVFGSSDSSRVMVSLNGVFVNGVRVRNGEVVDLGAGDEVTLVCAYEGGRGSGVRIGFVVRKIAYVEEIFDGAVSKLGKHCEPTSSRVDGDIGKLKAILGRCRRILDSSDPIYCIRKSIVPCNGLGSVFGNAKFPMESAREPRNGAMEGVLIDQRLEFVKDNTAVDLSSVISHREKIVVSEENFINSCNIYHLQEFEHGGSLPNNVTMDGINMLDMDSVVKENACELGRSVNDMNGGASIPSPGSKFYLNRLQSASHGSASHHTVVSLPEVLYPVATIKRIFITTFTSDIPWFLSYCEIPAHIPVTIACHNRDRCWSSSPSDRFSMPFSDFPNLIVVFPPFPEAVAFGDDRNRLGIACHHPKLFVLLREDSIRVVITSANLVAKQWNTVTNTVWWQDFPRTSRPDYLSLFNQLPGDINQDLQSDFAAQLAGFMASLIANVPCQAYWIIELTKYDFKGAVGHLVASVPGIHSRKASPVFESMYFSSGEQCSSRADVVKALGSIETFVVGLSHLFSSSKDSTGKQLKKLASFIQNRRGNLNGMLEVVLQRNKNIPADINAVSILVFNPKKHVAEDCVQLGFLPRHVAKWVAPLIDNGLFRFCGYVYPKEVLATALEGSTSKVHLLLYVLPGHSFSAIVESEYVFSEICTLIASIQRSTGIWRLHEVLSHYKWPEYLETDFIFGSSSIGAVNAQFLAAFSAAAGKSSVLLSESEESDPDWGSWSASQELRNPSMRIIFPTIQRVKTASCGILPSKHLLCFSEKTWYRLRNVGILHDAIPYPNDRVDHPMHVKVARRRFQSKTDASSCGWVYCGSHNFSAAAWGRPLSSSVGTMKDKAEKTHTILGSRLHICNYELGIIFVVPPSDTKTTSLDDIVLPFVVPAPKYRSYDRPATSRAMREAQIELREQGRETVVREVVNGNMIEEIPDEEDEVLEATNYVAEEQADEKAYAEALWSQVDSS